MCNRLVIIQSIVILTSDTRVKLVFSQYIYTSNSEGFVPIKIERSERWGGAVNQLKWSYIIVWAEENLCKEHFVLIIHYEYRVSDQRIRFIIQATSYSGLLIRCNLHISVTYNGKSAYEQCTLSTSSIRYAVCSKLPSPLFCWLFGILPSLLWDPPRWQLYL